jgi:hypothetical protein
MVVGVGVIEQVIGGSLPDTKREKKATHHPEFTSGPWTTRRLPFETLSSLLLLPSLRCHELAHFFPVNFLPD